MAKRQLYRNEDDTNEFYPNIALPETTWSTTSSVDSSSEFKSDENSKNERKSCLDCCINQNANTFEQMEWAKYRERIQHEKEQINNDGVQSPYFDNENLLLYIVNRRKEHNAEDINHKHMGTCNKFKIGKDQCRLAVDAALADKTKFTQLFRKLGLDEKPVPMNEIHSLQWEIIPGVPEKVNNYYVPTGTAIPLEDKRVLVFDIRRSKPDDQRVSIHNVDGFGVIGYNMNSQVCATESAAKNVMMYTVKYTTKTIWTRYYSDIYIFPFRQP